MRWSLSRWPGRFCAAAVLAALLVGLGVMPHAPLAAAAASTAERPTREVSLAQISVVRVLTYYYGTVSGSAPIPVLTPCAADGALIGTTGDGRNSYSYVLLPTTAVNPLTPCGGVQAAFQQLNGSASGWGITRIRVLLNAAYTGTGSTALGSASFSISPAQIGTNGGPGAPRLLALPLASGSTAHDLPVLALPQPSDPPAAAERTALDLVGATGAPLGRDAIAPAEVASTLYPVAAPLGQTPAALATLSAGTTIVDSNGRLAGMVVTNATGQRAVVTGDELKAAIGPVSGAPGPLMSGWQKAQNAFYAAPPQWDVAAAALADLARLYPDFGGVAPYARAVAAKTLSVAPLIQPAATATPPPAPFTAPAQPSSRMLLGGLAALLGLALLLVLALVVWRRRRRALAALPRPPAPEEAGLDLLPPGGALPETTEEVPTLKLPSPAGVVAGAEPPTQLMPTEAPTLHLPAPARVRHARSLFANASGLSDPGLRRAADPNQDNILAVHGLRQAGGRLQPYGLFVIADGMGGHLHGLDASRVAIEVVARAVLQPLTTSQPLEDAALTEVLAGAVRQANQELRRRNLEHGVDMGTTLTAVLQVDDSAHIVNVGDSRTYHLSPEHGLRQVTKDHSVVASLVTAGVIRPEDVYTHPRRNQIYRSLGGEEDAIEVDSFHLVLEAGDKLLLCSDGLWEMVHDPQIAHILRGAADPRQAAELLVREANANGGEDNISVIVVRMLEEMPQQSEPGLQVLAAPQSAELPHTR